MRKSPVGRGKREAIVEAEIACISVKRNMCLCRAILWTK
jgi:hypothetical protein